MDPSKAVPIRVYGEAHQRTVTQASDRRCRGSLTGSIERTIVMLLEAADHDAAANELANANGLLQRIDPRAKIIGMLSLVIGTVGARKLSAIAVIFLVAVTLAVLSKVSIKLLARRVWLSVLAFTGTIAFPALFLTPGDVLFKIPLVAWEITAQGLRGAAFLVARAETAATLALLLVSCTPWSQVLKALRVLHVPVLAVTILGMTHRYIFLLLHLATDMFVARRSRAVGRMTGKMRRHTATSSAGVLLEKSLELSGEVYSAMQSRGFTGEIFLLDTFEMKARDWCAVIAFLAFATGASWIGR
jgi:cobalt/nickel transport system permease protein